MQPFAYTNSPYPIRPDLPSAYQEAWRLLAHAGTWWTGEERVALAQEARNAQECDFCQDRAQALSPLADIPGEHNSTTQLSDTAIDVVHRLVTDASRLNEKWLKDQWDASYTQGHYVESISVVITVLCIDNFNRALGFDPEPLPQPLAGEPSRYTPPGLETETAWVPLLKELGEQEADLWEPGKFANVIRALSSVPDAVRLLKLLSNAQYLQMHEVANPGADGGRAISRAQIEFIAARVSAINDCFY